MIRWISLLCAMLSGIAQAANYYVRDGGDGSAPTTSWAGAYDQLSSAEAAASRGDTIYVADGTYSGVACDTSADGSQLITIRKATAAAHGTETGWNSTYGDGVATFAGEIVFATRYWNFDGVVGTGNSGHGFHVSLNSQTDAVTVEDSFVTIEHTKVSWPDKENLDHVPSVGLEAIFWTGSNYRAMSDITYRHCYLLEIPGSPFRFMSVSNILVENCYVDGNNSTPEEHASLMVNRGGCFGAVVRNSVFDRVEGTGGIVFYDVAHGSWDIYGNVFRRTSFGQGTVSVNIHPSTPDAAINNLRYYNNSHDNFNTGGNSGAYPLAGSNHDVKNNVWYRCDPVLGTFGDYNYHSDCDFFFSYTPAANDSPVFEDGSGKHSTLTASPFVDASNGNYRLTAALTSYPGQSQAIGSPDPDGNTRGGDGTWDRGAFEFGTGGGGPAGAPGARKVGRAGRAGNF